jgi:stalled ribosome rescue protein Dom34
MDIFSELTNNQNQNQNQNQNLLKQQMNTQQKINDLLEKSAQTIACGPQCQKNKVSEELKQKYLDIQTTIKNAPSILEQTKKTYYTYTKGKTYYNNMQETELKKNAEIIANELTIQFNKEVEIAHTMNSYLQTALINSGHTSELLSQYRNENYLLENELSSTYGDILTNDRKTYYESTATERLQLWHRFYKYVYYHQSLQ